MAQLALDLDDGLVTVETYDRWGRLVSRIDGVDLGDRVKAQQAGRESLHSAVLWGYLAAKRAQRDHPAEETTMYPPDVRP